MNGELRRTPFYDRHVALGARMVPFAGHAMPVQYPAGALAEYHAVRDGAGAGLFDISHMGQLRVRGGEALKFLQYAATNDATRLDDGQVQYSALLDGDGTFIDDITTYRVGGDHFYLCVNAANRARDVAHLARLAEGFDVEVIDESGATALLALQGARAQAQLQPLVDADLETIGYYRFAETRVCGAPAIVSRTGYTGEDGFEIYVGNDAAPTLWDALLDAGATPAGLAARDMLRTEMGYALYGHEIDGTVTPVEARLMWITKLEKGDFVGRDAVAARRERGPETRLVALRLTGRGVPREGYPVFVGDTEAGRVTSGVHSPLAGGGVALAFVAPEAFDAELSVGIRGRKIPARRVKPPFVRSNVRR